MIIDGLLAWLLAARCSWPVTLERCHFYRLLSHFCPRRRRQQHSPHVDARSTQRAPRPPPPQTCALLRQAVRSAGSVARLVFSAAVRLVETLRGSATARAWVVLVHCQLTTKQKAPQRRRHDLRRRCIASACAACAVDRAFCQHSNIRPDCTLDRLSRRDPQYQKH